MKRRLQLTIAIVCMNLLNTEAQTFSAGDNRIDVGLNIFGSNTWIGGGYELAVADNIGVRASAFFDIDTYYTSLLPTVRGSYYFSDLLSIDEEKLDLYAGLGLAKSFVLSSGYSYSSYVRVPIHAGARYFFTDKFGVMAEFQTGRGYYSGIGVGLEVVFRTN